MTQPPSSPQPHYVPSYPQAPQPPQKKSIFKRWWFWLTVGLSAPVVGFVAILMLVGIVGAVVAGTESDSQAPQAAATETAEPTAQADAAEPAEEAEIAEPAQEEEPIREEEEAEEEEPEVSAEFRAALGSAQSYADNLHMSKKGIYDQLISEYGENFPKDAAQYAIDNVEADWKENALETAKSYQETMDMSREGIREQLVSEYGEQFTEEEADYAMKHLPK